VRTQLRSWRAALDAGAGRVGWKVALGIAEVEEPIGSEPAIDHLTTATLLQPGGVYRGAQSDRQLRAETELAEIDGLGAVAATIAA
jgi:hypothetical protein